MDDLFDMSKKKVEDVEMLDEYDFSGGVRGKYVENLTESKNIVVPEADVDEVFGDSKSVNEALRGLLPVIQKQAEKVNK